jgi:putative FmdB family regulatory protein
MPLYEYECKNCEHSFEITQSFNDKPKKKKDKEDEKF